MWLIIFMVAFVVPLIIWGCVITWRENHDKKLAGQ